MTHGAEKYEIPEGKFCEVQSNQDLKECDHLEADGNSYHGHFHKYNRRVVANNIDHLLKKCNECLGFCTCLAPKLKDGVCDECGLVRQISTLGK